HNGVDIERFRPQDRLQARLRLGLPADIPVAGIVAALRPEKQHGLLLEAMRLVVKQFPGAELVVVGDGVKRQPIEAKACELGISDHVRLLGTRHDVPDVLPALDVKVLSSKMEANPASTLEASSCGVPVVAPRVGSLPETVVDGVTGVLYPPDDACALADALIRLFADPRRARAMGRRGRELVCRRFSLESMVRGYELLIDGVYRAACHGRRFTPAEFDRLRQVEAEPAGDAVPAASVDGSPNGAF
ncbi:MAG: glycosyltransferase, partial [Planctomycetota bacterium]